MTSSNHRPNTKPNTLPYYQHKSANPSNENHRQSPQPNPSTPPSQSHHVVHRPPTPHAAKTPPSIEAFRRHRRTSQIRTTANQLTHHQQPQSNQLTSQRQAQRIQLQTQRPTPTTLQKPTQRPHTTQEPSPLQLKEHTQKQTPSHTRPQQHLNITKANQAT